MVWATFPAAKAALHARQYALLRERMAFLAEKCTGDPLVVRAAGEKAASLTDTLAAHVPAELRHG